MISIRNLEKYFNRGRQNELHVLNGINLEFESAGMVCIWGESGSGKTTLLNTIGGLDVFTSGEIAVGDTKLKKYDPKRIEKIRNDKFGYVFQNYYLLQDYTVSYNVKLALNTFDLSEEEKEERVAYVLEKLQIARYKKKLVSQLSNGQQQRVSIARALVKSPKIILADEPTGNLDEENTLRTMNILKNISRECLVIVVTHEKRIAKLFADRILEIQDGRIIKDYQNTNPSVYQRMDDENIYLQDMEQTKIEQGEDFLVSLYREPGEKTPALRFNMAWKNGKLYIQNLTDCDILMESADINCEMIDAKKPDIGMEQIEEFDFSLPRIEKQKNASLARREIWKLAIENIRLMGKKQSFIITTLLVMSVLLTISLANYAGAIFYDKKDVVTTDSHYIAIEAETAAHVFDSEYDDAFSSFYQDCKDGISDLSVFKSSTGSLNFYYSGFPQLEGKGIGFTDFSYVSIEHVSEEDLIYGRMPENLTEIVVDRWLIDRFLETNSPYKSLYDSVEDFVDEKLIFSVTQDTFTIVGISDTNEPDIYLEQNAATMLNAVGCRMMTQEQAEAVYGDSLEYEGETALGDDGVYLSSDEYEKMRRQNKLAVSYSVTDTSYFSVQGGFCIPENSAISIDYILTEAGCKKVLEKSILSSKKFYLYTDDVENVMEQLTGYAEKYKDTMTVSVTSPYSDQIKAYQEEKQENTVSRNLLAAAAVVVSFVVVFFMVKSNVASRTEELTVYRLLGIVRGSIMQAYLLEMLLITTYTALPGVLLTSGVIHFFSSIPSLGIDLAFPWWCSFVIILVLYLLNLITCLLPVRSILSKPPAELAIKGN
ncbi:MAG: ABC transporter ATP-binding protein/permease [Clostridiaceae bacterium]|nr:ABC transporter ATP-binding protein/permease [Clostridiaceae bacterium]